MSETLSHFRKDRDMKQITHQCDLCTLVCANLTVCLPMPNDCLLLFVLVVAAASDDMHQLWCEINDIIIINLYGTVLRDP